MTLNRLDFTEQVTILVGSNAEAFTIPKTLAVDNSPYLRTALANGSKEARKNTVRLPDANINIDTFKAFVQWLYTGEIVVLDSEETKNDKNGTEQYLSLMKLYMLGFDLQSIRLRNAVINNFIAMNTNALALPNEVITKKAFRNTPEDSTLQKLLTEFYQHCEDAEWLKKRGGELPHSFLLGVVHSRALLKGRKAPMLKYAERCKFHEHNDEHPKVACNTR